MQIIFYVVFGALFDRARGYGESLVPNALWAVLWGFLLSWLIFPEFTGWMLAYTALFTFGSRPGWGNPIGRAIGGANSGQFERWQVGALKKNVSAALAVRGLIWMAPTLILWPVAGDKGLLAISPALMAVAFTAAPYVAKKAFTFEVRWAAQEFIRGGLFSGVMALLA